MKWFFAAFLSICFVFLTVFGINCVYGTLFPMKFVDEVSAASEKFEVDEAVIFSIINIESHFRADAVSPKGAVGLMQILPATAQELALANNMENFDLKNPATNISFGTQYFAKLFARFQNLQVALCAYNAGPANVAKWLADEKFSQDGKTLKEIPFAETKGYAQKFQKNLKYYMSKTK